MKVYCNVKDLKISILLSWQRFPNLLFLWRHTHIAYAPFLKILSNLPPNILLPCFLGWICDHATLSFCPMILWITNTNLLKVWHRWHDFCKYSDFMSHTDTGHTGTNILTHTCEYILTPPVMYTQQLPVLHCVNNLPMQKFTLESMQYLCFPKITIS